MSTATEGRGNRFKALLICVVVLLPIVPFVAHPIVNSRRFQRLAREWSTISHPPGTTRGKAASDFGNLSGTGNHCDYFVGERRSYTGLRQDILSFYTKVEVWNPATSSRHPVKVIFIDDDLGASNDDWLLHLDLLNGWGLTATEGNKKFYVAYFFAGHRPGCDLRCH